MTGPGEQARRDGGFTLIELLVSLGLLALMLALINGAFGFGLRAWEMTEEVERTQSVEAFRNMLDQRLSEALPLMSSDERGVLRLAFAGAPDELRFVTPMPSRGGLPGGLYQATLRLVGSRQRQLALELQPLVGANRPAAAEGHGPVVLGDVADFAVRYYGAPDGSGEPHWADAWRGRRSLPRLVAVDVRFARGDGRSWAPFTTELRLRSRTAGPS
jgi:prepilin-type N-terminal cleavage/methylation domain-containing protein